MSLEVESGYGMLPYSHVSAITTVAYSIKHGKNMVTARASKPPKAGRIGSVETSERIMYCRQLC